MKKIKKETIVTIIVSVLTVGIALHTLATTTRQKFLMTTSETIMQKLYAYNDMNTLLKNAEILKGLCDESIFPILDNSSRGVVTRRFSRYTPTSVAIRDMQVSGNRVSAVVTFNYESNLPDKYIILTYASNKLINYQEFDFVRAYEESYDYLGSFWDTVEGDSDYTLEETD